MMDHWSAELVLSVIQYLNVRDNGRLSATSSRYYYLVHEYRRLRGPELAATSSSSSLLRNATSSPARNTRSSSKRQGGDGDDIIKKMHESVVEQLQAPPNLALCFTKSHSDAAKRWMDQLSASLPSNTVIINATASAIQTCLPFSSLESSSLEYTSFGNGMFLSLGRDDVSMVPFCFPHPDTGGFEVDGFEDDEEEDNVLPSEKLWQHLHRKNNNSSFWSVFIVYAGGGCSMVEDFVNQLQNNFPHATIVGGICDSGDVSVPLRNDDDTFVWSLDHMTNVELMRILKRLTGGKQEKSSFPFGSSAMRKADIIHQIKSIVGDNDEDDDNNNNNDQEQQKAKAPLRRRPQFLLREIQRDSIWGVALGGNVPVRSIVSRGVKSLILEDDQTNTTCLSTTTTTTTPFYIHDVEFHRPGDDAYLFRLPAADNSSRTTLAAPSYHLVRKIINRDTNKQYTPRELYTAYGTPDVVGIQRVGSNGYDLLTPHPLSHHLNAFIFMENSNMPAINSSNSLTGDDSINVVKSMRGANVDLFDIEGQACLQDMEEKMQWLQKQTKDEQLLGAIMFSCNGRGPRCADGGLLPETMADAKRFQKYFTQVPCCGFYAGGEIGPLALARRRQQQQEQSNQHFQSGNATLQGFTAVFAVWIVPKVDWKQVQQQSQANGAALLDDSPSKVQQYLEERKIRRTMEEN